MALNVLSYLTDQFSPSVVDQLSQHLNETPAHVQKAVGGTLPALLGGLASRAGQGGADDIIDLLKKGTYSKETTPIDASQVVDTREETGRAVANGRTFVDGILGDNAPRIAEHIAQYSGVQPASALSIMSLAGSVLMGVLGRQQHEQGLSDLNLKSLLLGQTDIVRGALPAGLSGVAGLLGLDALRTPTGGPAEVQGADYFSGTPLNPNIPKSTDGERQRENIRWLRWAMFALAALVIALIVQKCREPQNGVDGVYTDTTRRAEPDAVEDTTASTLQNIEDANGQASDSTVPGALGIRTPVQLPGGRQINVAEKSFNANLAAFMAGKERSTPRTFRFDNLTFETGSARITTDSRSNLNDLIQIMQAYPSLSIRVEGHTDNTGNGQANQKLSLDRANAVRAALTEAGIEATRIVTQGFGSSKPITTNNTEEGRGQNRRIDVIVTKV
ncbi:OmpA family protein [Rudanella paleaurantiibacter]|uniref:OmpA family protein n=1 Tax=Rudanella paleaurantiibacter TaxID=2614655 RepID=A0A7J5U4H4_9BACT|nr:OmpA family protein [Rudanella paleaurantiibacter]KAB7732744.1 OmpA family protein [Rudanella paleaurantiibacter]